MLEDLVGKPLEGFTVQKLVEVYATNEDGLKQGTLAYFKNPVVAAAFAKQAKAGWGKPITQEVLALTNGSVAYLLGDEKALSNDEEALAEIKQKALEKLDPEERRVLGL